MRRFLIWSGLAVVVGLILAGAGVWAYDYFYARYQPVTIQRGQADIQRLLDESSWVSAGGGGQPLYIIGYRDSAATQSYERTEAEKLRAGGVEVRVVLFARAAREGLPQSTATERATLAELWLTRDWSLYQRWTATPSRDWTAAGIPPADGNLARSAVVEAGRQFADRLGALMRDAGVRSSYPLVIWRDREGFLKACACSDSRSWAFIRDDFGAPDDVTIPATPVPESDPAILPTVPVDPAAAGTAHGLPYPTLPAIPPAVGPAPPPGAAPPVTATAPTAAPGRPATTRPQAARPTRPATAPPPIPEDTTFY